jgi:hypothetical protein
VVYVSNDGDIANTRVQIENSSGLRTGTHYYFTMEDDLKVDALGIVIPSEAKDLLSYQCRRQQALRFAQGDNPHI